LFGLLLVVATAAFSGAHAQGLEASNGNIKDDAGDNNLPTAAPVITEYWDFLITTSPTSAPVIVDAAAVDDGATGQPSSEAINAPTGEPTDNNIVTAAPQAEEQEVDAEKSDFTDSTTTSTPTNGDDSSSSNSTTYSIIFYVVIGAVVCCGIAAIAVGWTLCKYCCCQQQPQQPDAEKPGNSTRIATDDEDKPAVRPETTDRTLEDEDELPHRHAAADDVVLDLESGVVPHPKKRTQSNSVGTSLISSDNHSHHSRGSYCSGRSHNSRGSSINSRPLLHCPKLDHYNSHHDDNHEKKKNRKNNAVGTTPRRGGSARFGDPSCYLVSANLARSNGDDDDESSIVREMKRAAASLQG